MQSVSWKRVQKMNEEVRAEVIRRTFNDLRLEERYLIYCCKIERWHMDVCCDSLNSWTAFLLDPYDYK